jgi:hypothetical protein
LTSEAKRFRERAERCLRLSKEALPDHVKSALRDLAAESLEKAQALEGAAGQQQRQVGTVAPPPEPSPGAAQQQQQQQQQPTQPDKAEDPE